jgi:hypothetical protein
VINGGSDAHFGKPQKQANAPDQPDYRCYSGTDEYPATSVDATYPRHKLLLKTGAKAGSNAMADDDIQHLMNAREALVARRLTLAQTIATPGDISENAIRGLLDVQRAIEVVDVAIEELEQDELDKELDETEDAEDDL